MRSRLVILDANVIIDAFAGGFWDALVARYEVCITSIVLHSEVFFYEDAKGQRVPINLEPYLISKKVVEIAASTDELAALTERVNLNLLDRIDDGEQEALALLLTGRFDDHQFCTGDTRAIKALTRLSLGALGISLEELLTQIGMKKKLPNPSDSKAAFDRKKAEGIQEQEMFLRRKT